jgi:hypothetical protein
MISKCHQYFTCHAPSVIENPEEILGENYQSLLNFWIYLDTLDAKQWLVVNDRFDALGRELNLNVTNQYHMILNNTFKFNHFSLNVFNNIFDCYKTCLSVRGAAFEIYNAQVFLEQGINFTFLPLFDNL